MKVKFSPKVPGFRNSHDTIHLEPENDRECQELEKVLEKCKPIGFGRDPETSKLLHLHLQLRVDAIAADVNAPACTCNKLKKLNIDGVYYCPHEREFTPEQSIAWSDLNEVPEHLRKWRRVDGEPKHCSRSACRRKLSRKAMKIWNGGQESITRLYCIPCGRRIVEAIGNKSLKREIVEVEK